MPSESVERSLAAIMFTDIVGYTALMGRDEAAGRRVRARHQSLVRPLVARYQGQWVEEKGDESLSIFSSAVNAVNCALAIQAELTGDAELSLRIGIHLGDVSVEGGRVFGDGVNVASRIRELAEPGRISVSGLVYDSIKNQPHIDTTAKGERALRNVERPVAVFAVTGTGSPPALRAAFYAERAGPREGPGSRAMRFRFAPFLVDSDLFELRRDDQPVEIQPKALSLLVYLLENRDRTVSKRELLDALWPDVTVGEGSLTRAINQVRSALGETQRDAAVIRTVHTRGYRIGIPVQIESHSATGARSDFVCRERELEAGHASLEAALSGRGQVLLITGEPGIGKTRLAEEVARSARERGADLFWGRCHGGVGVPAYWPWIQILRSYVLEREPASLGASLGAGASEVAALVPEVRERLPELDEPVGRAAQDARFHLFDAVARLLRSAAEERPLVLILDDAHRASRGSLLLLAHLARELAPAPSLLIATYRDAELTPDHPLGEALVELARGTSARRTIALEGMGEGCVGRFMASVGRIPLRRALIEAVHRRTEGNPLFVLEIVQWLETQPADAPLPDVLAIPEGIRQVIRGRLAALSDECRPLLTVAAVLGRDFRLVPIARVTKQSEESVLERLAEAEATRIVAPVEGSRGLFCFSHPLIRETLYDELPTATRAGLHRQIAEVLEVLYTPRPIAPTNLRVPIDGSRLAELAHHFCEGVVLGDFRKAVDYALRAAEHAASVPAPEEATRQYQCALAILGDFDPAEQERDLRARLERTASALGL